MQRLNVYSVHREQHPGDGRHIHFAIDVPLYDETQSLLITNDENGMMKSDQRCPPIARHTHHQIEKLQGGPKK